MRFLMLILLAWLVNGCSPKAKPVPEAAPTPEPIAVEPEPVAIPDEVLQPLFIDQIHRVVAMLYRQGNTYPIGMAVIDPALVWRPTGKPPTVLRTAGVDGIGEIVEGEYVYMPAQPGGVPQLVYRPITGGEDTGVTFLPLLEDQAPGMHTTPRLPILELQALDAGLASGDWRMVAERTLRDLLIAYVTHHGGAWPRSRMDLAGVGLIPEGGVQGLALWWDPTGKKAYVHTSLPEEMLNIVTLYEAEQELRADATHVALDTPIPPTAWRVI
ncbi:MAG TPA: hypothetical protein VEI97_20915 [bacterium]|nr:hypothetical protein [bacterium]